MSVWKCTEHISIKMSKNLFFQYPTDWNEIQHLSMTDTKTASFNKSGEPSLTPDPAQPIMDILRQRLKCRVFVVDQGKNFSDLWMSSSSWIKKCEVRLEGGWKVKIRQKTEVCLSYFEVPWRSVLCCVTAADPPVLLSLFSDPPSSHSSSLGDSETLFRLHWHCSAKLCLTRVPLHSRAVTGESRCHLFSLSSAFTMVTARPKH